MHLLLSKAFGLMLVNGHAFANSGEKKRGRVLNQRRGRELSGIKRNLKTSKMGH